MIMSERGYDQYQMQATCVVVCVSVVIVAVISLWCTVHSVLSYVRLKSQIMIV